MMIVRGNINIDVSEIILGIGSYSTVLSGNTVFITGDAGNAWEYYGPAYKKLAPRLATYIPYAEKYAELLSLRENALQIQEYMTMRKQIEDQYIESYYETRLKELDVLVLLNTLQQKFGNQIILLCHENIEEFCHRRLVADYIELKTGVYIPEVTVSSDGIIQRVEPIRYKERLQKVISRR